MLLFGIKRNTLPVMILGMGNIWDFERMVYYTNTKSRTNVIKLIVLHVVLGRVFENDGKNHVLSFRFRFFKTQNETTSFRLVVLG